MDHLVDPQGTACGESFLAFVTLIWLLSRVYSLVIFQSSLHSECLPTCFTLKRFLMSMVPSDVNIEVELFLKHFITALMWTLSICTNVFRVHMSDTVLVQLCRRLELLGAVLTQEGKFSCNTDKINFVVYNISQNNTSVIIQVSFQACLGGKASYAVGLITFERLFTFVYLQNQDESQ